MKKTISLFLLVGLAIVLLAFTGRELDNALQSIIRQNGLNQHAPVADYSDAKVELGRMLFFDKILSGNKDISCATCHHPALGSADALPLAIGVGGEGLGAARQMGKGRERIPRNSPDIFNRGAKEWHTMFWDNRVSGDIMAGYESPADEKLIAGLENILAVQAMFPVTSRDEMRGEIGDRTVNGEINELALISNAMPQVVWHRLMLRLKKIPAYVELFEAAYPDEAVQDLGFQHAANAIAAFETEAFTFHDSPWDLYMDGMTNAIDESAKRGAVLFYGKANCSTCHSGNLMSDQQAHNIGVPQLGPGKGTAEPLDVGRYLETGDQADAFAFRTPSLKNTAITGPWMHNGAYNSLEEAVRHHLDPKLYLQQYDASKLPKELQASFQDDEEVAQRMLGQIDPALQVEKPLEDKDIGDILSFLYALTDQSALELEHLVPATVPSGLPVKD
ncbi:MAG: hypothetical protein KTR30_01795 [Saprospiraceae bacterium]|nr:hypothetical protein [Saprospiraceae bacterium]